MAIILRAAILGSLAVTLLAAAPSPADPLADGFRDPPPATKPWCYWYWISDNLSKDGLTRDLEAMARVGIGEAFIGNIFLDDIPAGNVKVLSEPWWDLVEHAIREGGRVGVDIGMFNCPGWSQSGGPWIKPEQAMRYLVCSETRVRGPAHFAEKLAQPAEPFQDVAVLALPSVRHNSTPFASRAATISSTPAAPNLERLTDGNLDTATALPPGAGQGNRTFAIDFNLPEPATIRSLSMIPSDSPWAARCAVQSAGDDGTFQTVREFQFDRSNMRINVGPMPRGPVTIALPPTTAKQFRLVLTGVTGKAALAEVELSADARVEFFIEKQLAKVHPTPSPKWDTYLWPEQPEPDAAGLAMPPADVRNLTPLLGPDGTLRWDVPPGDWTVLRIGMTPTGTQNAPASAEGQGLEVDKMNRNAAKAHFDAFIGRLLRRMPASDRKAFRHVVADSYEMGPQNWTDGFADTFRSRYGYDPEPWLPVLSGRIVAGADESNRFLWDLRRLVADHVAKDYVGGLRDLCHEHGLQLWLENYGHWGFPAEFLQYGGQSDRIGGEFWLTGLGAIECRAASSAANIYGMPIVSAEAFTGGPPFQTMPSGLKTRGDWAFCEGANHFVLHVYIHQPWEDRKPGMNAWFGTEFNRHNTWFNASRAWIDYLRRSCFLLQQGNRVADVAYFIGEDTPKMTGPRQPELPPGCDFDDINAEVIQQRLGVENGMLKLPHGTTYRVLVLPDLPTMRPELLAKIRELVEAGATVLGPPPSRSPSLEDYPRCDDEVRRLAAELWGDARSAPSGQRRLGKGQILWGKDLRELLHSTGAPPDFTSGVPLRFTHRKAGDTDLYFLANPQAEEIATTVAFRIHGKSPELWWPHSGRIERAAVYDQRNGTVCMPIHLGPRGSVFVVFRQDAARFDPILSVTRNGQPLLETNPPPDPRLEFPGAKKGSDGDFTLAVWAKPSADTHLLEETNAGVHGMNSPRNDAMFPAHGETLGQPGSAGAGLAVGRNGVCVFEHGASYFAPVLVHAAKLSDWTHIAVVYRNNRPTLYLDGVLAREGLKSNHTVLPSNSANGGGSPFRGEIGVWERIPQAFDAAEVSRMMQSMPRPGTRRAAGAIRFSRTADGRTVATAEQNGTYVVRTAGGSQQTIVVDDLPAAIEINGPWDVRFAPEWGAPQNVTFERLEDWTQRSEEGIRNCSGAAVYRKEFELPEGFLGRSLRLDLGNVRDLATVRLNGRELGTVWNAPWRIDISTAARRGKNVLEIEVVNPWNNRLIADAKLPPEKRLTFLATDTLPNSAAPLPAGLLGPVILESSATVELKQ
ncbi:MAG: hypothetical protein GXY83_07205 [Rhodopirellula sp.]|nr:hypothetical protein [Rhodopirellula sp.]